MQGGNKDAKLPPYGEDTNIEEGASCYLCDSYKTCSWHLLLGHLRAKHQVSSIAFACTCYAFVLLLHICHLHFKYCIILLCVSSFTDAAISYACVCLLMCLLNCCNMYCIAVHCE